MKMKRMVALILSLMMTLVVSVQAEELQKPSGWAEIEISLASMEGLLPNELAGHYQNNITRAEYVLLAQAVLDEADIDIEAFVKYPFQDILGHDYEEAIVAAYNAGVIKGYEDGSFRPDNPITRQEMATLIVNLIKIIDHERIIAQRNTYEYSDISMIGAWAKDNVDYCYNNSIIKGVGVDVSGKKIIDPLGNATIEQSVVLMYRVADNEQILEDEGFASVVVGPNETSVSFDEFAENSDSDVSEMVHFFYESGVLSFEVLTSEMAMMTDGANSLMVVFDQTENGVTMMLEYPVETSIVEIFYGLVDAISPEADVENYVPDALEAFREDDTYKIDVDITSTEEFNAFSEVEYTEDGSSKRYYIFKYELDK